MEDDKVPEKTYTEVEMNDGIKEKELPETFAKPEYQVLLVAEKYQTGFDQPLLHTMYVDKRLGRHPGRADAVAPESHPSAQGRYLRAGFCERPG